MLSTLDAATQSKLLALTMAPPMPVPVPAPSKKPSIRAGKPAVYGSFSSKVQKEHAEEVKAFKAANPELKAPHMIWVGNYKKAHPEEYEAFKNAFEQKHPAAQSSADVSDAETVAEAMTASVPTTTSVPKPKKVLSPEHLAALKAGREAKSLLKDANAYFKTSASFSMAPKGIKNEAQRNFVLNCFADERPSLNIVAASIEAFGLAKLSTAESATAMSLARFWLAELLKEGLIEPSASKPVAVAMAAPKSVAAPKPAPAPFKMTREQWTYLLQLQESGTANMMSADRFLKRQFGLSEQDADDIGLEYLSNYAQIEAFYAKPAAPMAAPMTAPMAAPMPDASGNVSDSSSSGKKRGPKKLVDLSPEELAAREARKAVKAATKAAKTPDELAAEAAAKAVARAAKKAAKATRSPSPKEKAE